MDPTTAAYIDGDDVVVRNDCPKCLRPQEVRVKAVAFVHWYRDKVPLQDAFPDLTESQREVLSTGLCDKCWKERHGKEGRQ